MNGLREADHPVNRVVETCYGHAGPSMWPSLAPTDLLEVRPYAGRSPQVGDVILFRPPGAGPLTVHRVVGLSHDGVRTRGDNNDCEDSWRLAQDQIKGRVVAAWRRQRWRRVHGGRAGLAQALWARSLSGLDRWSRTRLHGVYRGLARRGQLGQRLRPWLQPRLVCFGGGGPGVAQLLLRDRLVGRYDLARQGWDIRRPFRLLLDEDELEALAARAQAALEVSRPGSELGRPGAVEP